ncbi:Hypothetical protein PHPALM_20737 [Phytophthora palmivora]|uniref:M96 mating-specific protein family n=1 Tax=Phytophthora palmivora TaxID=4796 RepID=A0A2P4XE50_9STRA|nr:Hypothetical protein PHPALM_20737 [Phytophthora palmivora]
MPPNSAIFSDHDNIAYSNLHQLAGVEDATPVATKQVHSTPRKRISAKQKIDTLKAEVDDLTTQLQELSSLLPHQEEIGKSTHYQLWEKIAKRQREQRQMSEEENAKLREMMEIQVLEARNLKRILKRRSKIEVKPSALANIEDHNSGFHHYEHEFEQLLRDVNDLSSRVESIFLEIGIDKIPCPGQKRRSVKGAINGVRLEMADRRVLPLNRSTVEKALWDALRQVELQDLRCVNGLATDLQSHSEFSNRSTTSTNTTMIRYFAAYSGDTTYIGGIRVRKIVRKCIRDNRSVFIYRMIIEPQLLNLKSSAGIHAVATLMMEVRHDGDVVSDDSRTLVQSYFYVTRHDQGLPTGQRFRLPDSMDIGLVIWDEILSRIYRGIETSSQIDAREGSFPNTMS